MRGMGNGGIHAIRHNPVLHTMGFAWRAPPPGPLHSPFPSFPIPELQPPLSHTLSPGGVGQAVASFARMPRKVRAPQGTVPGNAWAARADGKCNRKIPPNGVARRAWQG